MALSRYFPSGTNGDTLTAALLGTNSLASSGTGGTGTITSDTPLITGHMGARMAGAASSGAYYGQLYPITSGDTVGFDVYMTYEVLATGDSPLMWFGTGGTRCFYVALRNGGKIGLYNSAGTLVWGLSGTLTASTSTVVRIAGYVTRDASAGTARIKVHTGTDPNSLTLFEDSGALTGLATGAAGVTAMRIGPKAATANATPTIKVMSYAVDTAATAEPDPVNSNLPPTCTLTATETTDVEPGRTITLTASTTDSDGTSSITSLVQQSGTPTVPLSGSGTTRTFIAPATTAGTTLTFRATATDDDSATTTADVSVTVLPASWFIGGDTPAVMVTG